MAVPYRPDGYHTTTPYLVVKGGAAAIDYYVRAFGAVELFRLPGPGDTVAHAELRIGDSPLMLSDEHPDMGFVGPETLGGSPVGFCVYVEDVDAAFDRAVKAGGTPVRPVADQFYGDRSGTLKDPFGHLWTLSTHKEDVPPEELSRRMAAERPG
ncbi:VOC family protein [Acidobacteria bacterium ACD]|nr:MAG: VOC family protein [Acidobacteriota bacterium]MCE7957311.1 VOC family protein [Acidobacteria bacterium ACB2]MDL1952016.1 VOC family protein [Acidobacteria bacterium ACD]